MKFDAPRCFVHVGLHTDVTFDLWALRKGTMQTVTATVVTVTQQGEPSVASTLVNTALDYRMRTYVHGKILDCTQMFVSTISRGVCHHPDVPSE